MATTGISLIDPMTEPHAEVLRLATGERFIVVRFGEDASLIPPGVNATQIAYARKLATALNAAADEIAQCETRSGARIEAVMEGETR